MITDRLNLLSIIYQLSSVPNGFSKFSNLHKSVIKFTLSFLQNTEIIWKIDKRKQKGNINLNGN